VQLVPPVMPVSFPFHGIRFRRTEANHSLVIVRCVWRYLDIRFVIDARDSQEDASAQRRNFSCLHRKSESKPLPNREERKAYRNADRHLDKSMKRD